MIALLQSFLEFIGMAILSLVVAAVIVVGFLWVVGRLIEGLDKLVALCQPRCPACRKARLQNYSFLKFSDRRQYRYYACDACKASFKRSRKGVWVPLRRCAAGEKERQALFQRRTSVMKPSQGALPADPLGSWFGSVQVALPGEEWPTYQGVPMLPICQLRCAEIPTLPAVLSEYALICVFSAFFGAEALSPEGERWVVRTYSNLDALVPLLYPGDAALIDSYPVAWSVGDDNPSDKAGLPEELWIDFRHYHHHRYASHFDSKVGGYPSGSSCETPPRNALQPHFVFQTVSRDAFPWRCGPGGVLSFSCSSAAGDKLWSLHWELPEISERG